jgi:hypothetical protein
MSPDRVIRCYELDRREPCSRQIAGDGDTTSQGIARACSREISLFELTSLESVSSPPISLEENPMFASIVSKITTAVRSSVRAVGAATNKSPWLVSAAILAVFFVL